MIHASRRAAVARSYASFDRMIHAPRRAAVARSYASFDRMIHAPRRAAVARSYASFDRMIHAPRRAAVARSYAARRREQPGGPEQHEDDEDEERDADAPFAGDEQQRHVLQLRDDDRQYERAGDAADPARDHGDGRGQQRGDAVI